MRSAFFFAPMGVEKGGKRHTVHGFLENGNPNFKEEGDLCFRFLIMYNGVK